MHKIVSIISFIALTVLPIAEARSDSADKVAASPRSPWGEYTLKDKQNDPDPWWVHTLLWLPNRLLDFVDVIRLDVGAGPAYGAVARISQYAQVGYRSLSPASVRVGLFGRKFPVLVERSNEFGIGPAFFPSKDRKVCEGELGVGADLIIGGYIGICSEELLDFAAGLFFLDPSHDDIR